MGCVLWRHGFSCTRHGEVGPGHRVDSFFAGGRNRRFGTRTESLSEVPGEKTELKAKLENVVDKAKELCDRLQDQSAVAARAADKTIREHSYQAVGIALGLGMLLGVLEARSRRD